MQVQWGCLRVLQGLESLPRLAWGFLVLLGGSIKGASDDLADSLPEMRPPPIYIQGCIPGTARAAIKASKCSRTCPDAQNTRILEGGIIRSQALVLSTARLL